MKKLLLTCSALLFVVVLAQAQTCFDFTVYCDGLELTASGSNITGWWRNTDCAGTDVPVFGKVKPSGDWVVKCDWPSNPCPVSHDWGFFIDQPLDGTMDMYSNTGTGWTIWIDQLAYTTISGPCPFAPEEFGDGESTTMSLPEYDQ